MPSFSVLLALFLKRVGGTCHVISQHQPPPPPLDPCRTPPGNEATFRMPHRTSIAKIRERQW